MPILVRVMGSLPTLGSDVMTTNDVTGHTTAPHFPLTRVEVWICSSTLVNSHPQSYISILCYCWVTVGLGPGQSSSYPVLNLCSGLNPSLSSQDRGHYTDLALCHHTLLVFLEYYVTDCQTYRNL